MKQNFAVRRRALDGVEAVLSVAQHRNFRKAAAELGVTTSAISQAVRALLTYRVTRLGSLGPYVGDSGLARASFYSTSRSAIGTRSLSDIA